MSQHILGMQKRAMDARNRNEQCRNQNGAALSLVTLQSPTSQIHSPMPPLFTYGAASGAPCIKGQQSPRSFHVEYTGVLDQLTQNGNQDNDGNDSDTSSLLLEPGTVLAEEYFGLEGENKMNCVFAMAMGLTNSDDEPIACLADDFYAKRTDKRSYKPTTKHIQAEVKR